MMATDARPIVLMRFPSEALLARVREVLEPLEWESVICASMAEVLERSLKARPGLCLLQTPVAAGDLHDFDRLSHEPALQSLPSVLVAESSLAMPDFAERITRTMNRLLTAPEQLDPVDVMVVEDAVEELELLTSRLTRAGLKLSAVTSGSEALWLIRRTRPRMLLLDVAMPGGDGFELVSKLRRDPQFQHLPLLVYTGLNLQQAHRALLTLGPTRYLVKSQTQPEQLLAAIHAMLAGEP